MHIHLFSNLTLDWISGQPHASNALSADKAFHVSPKYIRLGGPLNWYLKNRHASYTCRDSSHYYSVVQAVAVTKECNLLRESEIAYRLKICNNQKS